MQESINNFINSKTSGLYLFDMPTGTGKTTQAVNYIFKHHNEKRNFFYITSLKKNVEDAYNKLKELFFKDNLSEEFEAKTLRLYANADKVIENIDLIKIDSNDKIMRFESFNKLVKEVKTLKKFEKYDPIIKENLEKEIKEKLEPEFRKDVKNYINELKRNKKDRFFYIKDKHSWLLKLYPSILTNYRNIFFITIDKFYLGNDTIIEPTYKFINHLIIKNSIVFIDEIDATKSTILNRQIDESLKNNIDLIQLFLNIHSTINNKDFPKEMLIPSKKESEKDQSGEGIINKIKKVFNDTFNENNMNYAFKLLEKDEDRKYIFDDNSIITITKESKINDLYINKSIKDNYNHIVLNKSKESKSLQNVIKKISGAVSYFINGCYMLAINYCSSYNERKNPNDDIMQIDDAVSSIIRAFNINERFINYLLNVVLSKGNNKFLNVGSLATHIYESGFRYYKFTDSITNNLSTVITMYDLNDTPENFLINVCKKAYVIGLSATSTMDTVTGNYDLRFIKQKLGDSFYKGSKEDNDRIDNEINNILDSNKSNINVELCKCIDLEKSLSNIFKSEDYCKYFSDLFKLKNNEFNNKRFIKVLFSVYYFILSNKPSLLILCNRNLSPNPDELYSYNNYKKAVEFILKENNIKDEYEIINLLSRDFEIMKTNYQKALSENKKVIIFSSYPTTGAGQNLQYEYEEDGIITSEDLSSIYIEKPTNMLVNTNMFNETTSNDLIKYIYQVESLKYNGEISIKDKNICIKESFLKTHDQESYRKHSNLYECNSIKNQGLSVLIQAVGRICRVRGKTLDTSIYVDYDIVNELDLLSIKNRRLNKEFREIINRSYQENINKNNLDLYELEIQRAENDNKIVNDNIHRIISNSIWSENDINLWKSLREHVLKYPCTDNNFGEANRFYNCYFTISNQLLNKYYYQQENDYGTVKIGLKKDYQLNSEVSEEECKINKLLNKPIINEYFINYSYATSFVPNKYIMLPVIYNNIYKGALGETIGKIIIEYMGYQLEEITEGEKFEKFDYRYKDIYIDFKFWNNRGQKLDIDKIINKANEVEASKALIINILGNSSENIHQASNNVYIIPSLIDENTLEINKKAYNSIKQILGGK